MNKNKIEIEKYYNPFKIKTIKEKDGFTCGIYVNRVPVCGLYIDGEERLLKDLEIKAKSKFKLECDPENYAQEVRFLYFNVLNKYIENFGVPENDRDINFMENYVARGCLNGLINVSKRNKNKVNYFDKEKEEFVIQNLIYISGRDSGNTNTLSLDTLEYMINAKIESGDKSSSFFKIWFNTNKHNILTKKQLGYLDNSVVLLENGRHQIEKNIIKRVDRKYSSLTINECRSIELNRKLDIINNILDSEKYYEVLHKISQVIDEEDWLLESLYSMDLDICKMITRAINGIYENSPKVIKICENLLNLEKTFKDSLKNINI